MPEAVEHGHGAAEGPGFFVPRLPGLADPQVRAVSASHGPHRPWRAGPGAAENRARRADGRDHFYPDSAFDAAVATHCANLPHWLALSRPEVERLALQPDARHSAWRWQLAIDAARDESVHPYLRPYAAWLARQPGFPAAASPVRQLAEPQ